MSTVGDCALADAVSSTQDEPADAQTTDIRRRAVSAGFDVPAILKAVPILSGCSLRTSANLSRNNKRPRAAAFGCIRQGVYRQIEAVVASAAEIARRTARAVRYVAADAHSVGLVQSVVGIACNAGQTAAGETVS